MPITDFRQFRKDEPPVSDGAATGFNKPWRSPNDDVHLLDVGTQVVLVVEERKQMGWPLGRQMVVVEATEDGWTCGDPDYSGYGPGESVCWALVSDLISAACQEDADAAKGAKQP